MSTATVKYIAGGVTGKAKEWAAVTNNQWVRSMVKGVKLELTGVPHQTHHPVSRDTEGGKILTDKVGEMLAQGVIERAEPADRMFVSHLFLRPKKDGDFRPILNLSKLNEYITYRHFKMEQLSTVMQLVHRGAWLASIDISQAYHSLEIREGDRDLLQFLHGDHRYRFRVLPNGLSSGPRIFTKIMKAVMSHLRENNNIMLCFYIDDTIIIGKTQAEVEKAVNTTLELLTRLGFTINVGKSVLVPTQEIQFLGFRIDTLRVRVDIPKKKREELTEFIRETLNNSTLTVRDLATLTGKLVATDPGNKWARIRSKTIVRSLNWYLKETNGNFGAGCTLTRRVKESLQFWLENMATTHRDYALRSVDVCVYTDASSHGWGYYDQTHGVHYGEQWDELVSETTHINVLELRAVRRMLEHRGDILTGLHVRVFADNTTTVACVSKGGSARSKPCQTETETIWEITERRDILLTIRFCPGVDNVEADWASRVFTDAGEWMLDKQILHGIFEKWGTPTTDMFASRTNKQIDRFISREFDSTAVGTDALSLNWCETNGLFFPPFSCLSRVLRKLEEERPAGVLIAPEWPTQPWYPLLRQLRGFKDAQRIPVRAGTLRLVGGAHKTFPLIDKMSLLAVQL